MDKGKKALKSGGRFLKDLFGQANNAAAGPSSSSSAASAAPASIYDDEDDALAGSQQAHSHTAALERFLAHVNAATAAAAAAAAADKAEGGGARHAFNHQPTLSSSSLSMSASTASSSTSSASSSTEGNDSSDTLQDHDPTLLRPSFRTVPLQSLQNHADASLALVDRIAAYVDERWRLESRYARERARLKLDLSKDLVGQGKCRGADSLDALLQALALFQEVEVTQVAATVEEIDRAARTPLLQLREQLHRILQDGRREMGTFDREVEQLQQRLDKSKAGLGRLRDRRDELRRRIEQYREIVSQQQQQQQLLRRGGSRGSGGSGSLDFPADAPDPGRVSGFVSDDAEPAALPPEAHILPSLERRLRDTELEMQQLAVDIRGQSEGLLEALGRQDRCAERWVHALERADKTRRFTLQHAATAYIEAEARAHQRSLFQLDSVTQLLARVDLGTDMQRFIAAYRSATGTPQRATALRLLLDREQRQREQERQRRQAEQSLRQQPKQGRRGRQRGGGDDDDDGDGDEGEEGEDADGEELDESGAVVVGRRRGSPPPPPMPPPPPPPREMATLAGSAASSGSIASSGSTGNVKSPSSTSSSAASSPDRAHHLFAGALEPLEPPFDEKEDGEVVAAFVRSLFAGEEDKAERQAPAVAQPSSSHAHARDESFDWDRFPAQVGAALKEGEGEEEAAGAASKRGAGGAAAFSFHSTEGERKRFFERIFAGDDSRGRRAFLGALNQQRSRCTNVGGGFEELAQLLWLLLLHCQRRRDVHNAKMGMMLANTFYRPAPTPASAALQQQRGQQQQGQGQRGQDPPPQRREFLSRRLQGHPLWSDAAFWTRALSEQIEEQLREQLPSSQAWHDVAAGEARDELVHRVHNVVFSNCAALAHSMTEFGAKTEDAREFILRVCESYGLSEEHEHMLLQHLQSRSRHHQAKAQHQHQQQQQRRAAKEQQAGQLQQQQQPPVPPQAQGTEQGRGEGEEGGES